MICFEALEIYTRTERAAALDAKRFQVSIVDLTEANYWSLRASRAAYLELIFKIFSSISIATIKPVAIMEPPCPYLLL